MLKQSLKSNKHDKLFLTILVGANKIKDIVFVHLFFAKFSLFYLLILCDFIKTITLVLVDVPRVNPLQRVFVILWNSKPRQYQYTCVNLMFLTQIIKIMNS